MCHNFFSNPFLGIIGTLSGGFIGAWANSIFSLRAINRQNLISASTDFCSIFTNTLSRYNLAGGTAEIEFILKEELPKQAAAIEKYRRFVKLKNKEAYQKAWETYYTLDESLTDKDLHFAEYSAFDDRIIVFKERIEAILKYSYQ